MSRPRGDLRQGVWNTALALLWVASTALTLGWTASMSGMGAMPMPGGWYLSMTWAPMCGQTWAGTATTFFGMWAAMMAAMMLPACAPLLRSYRLALAATRPTRRDGLAALLGAGYFFTWILCAVPVFVLGAALAAVLMQETTLARAAPLAAGVVVLAAGALQFTGWKARRLAACRLGPCAHIARTARAAIAWRLGVRMGLHCCQSCAGPTAVLLALGVMEAPVMAAVTAAIALERLAPRAVLAARLTGAIALGAGTLMIARVVAPA